MPILGYLGHYGNLRKVGSSVLNSLKVSYLTSLIHEALNLFGSMNYFDQVGHKILQNPYLKTSFENTNLRFCSHFKKGGSSKCEQKRTRGEGGSCLVERSQRNFFFIDVK